MSAAISFSMQIVLFTSSNLSRSTSSSISMLPFSLSTTVIAFAGEVPVAKLARVSELDAATTPSVGALDIRSVRHTRNGARLVAMLSLLAARDERGDDLFQVRRDVVLEDT